MLLASFGLQGVGLLLIAPVVGSFLGTVVQRLPEGRPIVFARSRCEECGAGLTPRDLVPLLSWLLSRGRCRHCGHLVGWFYPGVEIAALAVALIALAVDGMPRAGLDCIFGWWLLTLGWIDLRRWVLPDVLTLPLLLAGLGEAALIEPAGLLDRALAAAAGYLSLRAVALAYRLLRGREGLGGGDAKLLGAAGAWIGAMALPQAVLGAALTALAAAAVLQLNGVRMHARSAMTFGPFIALASWALWLWGPLPL